MKPGLVKRACLIRRRSLCRFGDALLVFQFREFEQTIAIACTIHRNGAAEMRLLNPAYVDAAREEPLLFADYVLLGGAAR
jgi:hypothetical protein